MHNHKTNEQSKKDGADAAFAGQGLLKKKPMSFETSSCVKPAA
jgi:hypothetical protein